MAAYDDGRPLATLPKAHLHLHLTGSMRHSTLVDLAAEHGVHLPRPLEEGMDGAPVQGWPRFQRLYDIARSVVRAPNDVRRLLREVADDERAAGSGWVEIQVTPGPYAHRLGGLNAFLDLLLDAAAEAEAATGVGVGIILAANRTRPLWDALTLARLAVRNAGRVVGFGLSNDERRGPAGEFARAFRLTAEAGLIAAPHAGELLGPASVRDAVHLLGARRLGHGVRAVEDRSTVAMLAERGVVLEVCPTSNVALGVAAGHADVPLRALLGAGVPVALNADDPLLFGDRLLAQYELARSVHGLSDAALADLARTSIWASGAPDARKARLLAGVDDWLASPP